MCEATVCNQQAEAAHTIREYEVAALERLVGKQIQVAPALAKRIKPCRMSHNTRFLQELHNS